MGVSTNYMSQVHLPVPAGQEIPDIQSICNLCTRSHCQLLPDVPLVGWDVALTAEHGPFNSGAEYIMQPFPWDS
jgi:hypothetical protein